MRRCGATVPNIKKALICNGGNAATTADGCPRIVIVAYRFYLFNNKCCGVAVLRPFCCLGFAATGQRL